LINVFFVFGLLTLVGCNGTEIDNFPQCPAVIIVKDTSELTSFRKGSEQHQSDVKLKVRIDSYKGECQTSLESDRSGKISVDLQLKFDAILGSASINRKESFKFYVAIVNIRGDILAKKIFSTSLEFNKNIDRLFKTEKIIQKIFLRSGESGVDFDILVGLHLSPDQLKHNLTKKYR
tara:strand:+ start:556 stop:1086 length:531 start_codon:yes stop_codon:yes gene_type:complete